MKALVYDGPGERSWDSVDDPTIAEPSDVIGEAVEQGPAVLYGP